ncbi:MAG: hypothetical protein ABII76_22220 [Pseudomonadota bacterium]
MADVITLDGLETGTLAGAGASCGKLVPIHAPVLGQTIQVCESDVKRMAGLGAVDEVVNLGAPKRSPGRPRGTTVKRGAKAPKFGACSKTKKITTKTGRVLCKCADQGNGQILAGRLCGLPNKRGK